MNLGLKTPHVVSPSSAAAEEVEVYYSLTHFCLRREKSRLLRCLHSVLWANQFFISISRSHTLRRSRRWSALAQWCSAAPLVHTARSHYEGLRATHPSQRGRADFLNTPGSPRPPLSLNSEHNAPLNTGDCLPHWQIYGSGPDAADVPSTMH